MDYRHIDAVTIEDAFPIPRIDEALLGQWVVVYIRPRQNFLNIEHQRKNGINEYNQ